MRAKEEDIMSKSIMIYQCYNGKRTQITQWCNFPDFVLQWFSKTFSNEIFDDQLRPFDLNNPELQKFLLVCFDYFKQLELPPSLKFLELDGKVHRPHPAWNKQEREG